MKIGIDAGGTKTTAQLFDSEGNIIKTVKTGFGNPLINYREALNNIEEAIDNLIESSPSPLKKIAIGSAGAESGGYVEEITHYFEKKFQTSVIVMSDLALSHTATFNNKDGILLIAGTGSSCLYRKNGQFYQKGGWGHILGDEGSAYWLGLQLLKQLMAYFDQSPLLKDADILIPELLKLFPSKKEVIELVYRKPKACVAEIAQLTEDFKQAEFIQDLNKECANHLTDLVLSSTETTGEKVLSIALEGSVITKNKAIQTHFLKNLTDTGHTVNLITTSSGTNGVLYM